MNLCHKKLDLSAFVFHYIWLRSFVLFYHYSYYITNLGKKFGFFCQTLRVVSQATQQNIENSFFQEKNGWKDNLYVFINYSQKQEVLTSDTVSKTLLWSFVKQAYHNHVLLSHSHYLQMSTFFQYNDSMGNLLY